MGIRQADNPKIPDEIRVSEIGGLRRLDRISQVEYEAGVRYGNIMLQYLSSIDAPEPYGGDMGSLSDDLCFGRKMKVAAAKTILREYGPECMRIVDRVTVYDEPTRDDHELELLRAGLRGLAGLPMRGDSADRPSDRESVWDAAVSKIVEFTKKESHQWDRY